MSGTESSAAKAASASSTPWHLWAVGVVSLLWNAYGGYDYLMSETRNAEYLAMFGPDMALWLDGLPAWSIAAWAIGVWGSIAGSVLLLFRSRHAALAFLISVIGALISFAYQFSTDMPDAMESGPMRFFPLLIAALIVLQWWYARREAAAGVLR